MTHVQVLIAPESRPRACCARCGHFEYLHGGVLMRERHCIAWRDGAWCACAAYVDA